MTDIHSPDAPLRLAAAAAIAFPDGSMTETGLRTEARRGRLAVERIAGKDYTTLRAIEEMRKLCRVERKAPASIPARETDGTRSGSSETERMKKARAAALEIGRELSERLKATSRENTGPAAQVVRLRS